jgi:hypothetical protein
MTDPLNDRLNGAGNGLRLRWGVSGPPARGERLPNQDGESLVSGRPGDLLSSFCPVGVVNAVGGWQGNG